MKRPYLTLKQMAGVFNMSEEEVMALVKNKQIPHEITDKGTVWEAYRFIEKDVLIALGPRGTREEEPKKEPEPEKATEEEAVPEPEELAVPEPEEPIEEQPQPEQASERTEGEEENPFADEEAKKGKKSKK